MANPTTSIHQAVQTSLKVWLASQFSDFSVYDRWPNPDVALPPKAMTVLRAGAPEFTWLDEDEVSSTLVSGNNYLYWIFAAQVELPIQIDVWAQSDVMRDDAIARLEIALHASKASTIPAYLASQGNTLVQSFFESAITLQCASPWDQVLTSMRFESPTIDDDPDSAKRREFRTTYRGTAYYDFVYQTTQPQIDMIVLREYATTSANMTPPTGALNHILTVTQSGGSQSDGT